jgi:hypothetical protein
LRPIREVNKRWRKARLSTSLAHVKPDKSGGRSSAIIV